MLTAVVDRTDGDGSAKVRSAFGDVEARLEERGLHVRWPVSAEIVDIPIMGASKSAKKHHTLYVSAGAIRSGALDGLVAHEMGHMLLTESGHASHNSAVFKQIGQTIRIPSAASAVFAEAFNHIQDIYADDLSFQAGLGDRAYGFFSSWIAGHKGSMGHDRWWNVGVSVSNGFALGNLVRHRLIGPEDGLWETARSIDHRAKMRAVDEFADFFASLPIEPKPKVFVGSVQTLADSMAHAHDSRMF